MGVPKYLGEADRYRIEAEIGHGGMGRVYRAYDRNTDQQVAIKVMADTSNAEAFALFDKERKILAELQHTNIIAIVDRGEFRDGAVARPFFVMPFLRGKTLHDRIHAGGPPLEVEDVVRIIAAVSAGLQAAHNGGVVHRDIKPGNIFVLESGAVVLIDFGVVHFADVGGDNSLTSLKGTTPYMAPELLDPGKKERPSALSDLFSLGVVTYEALTGIQPFSRPGTQETVRAILNDIPAPAYEHNRNVTLGLSQVVQKCLAKDKLYRFKTVADFAGRLERASRNEPIPEFDRSVFEDRMRVVREAVAKGQMSSAHELLRGLEEEGYVDPSIINQRAKIDQARQQQWIEQQLASARLYREAREYQTALDKVEGVLKASPGNADALAERDLIDRERLERVLHDAQVHILHHEFREARGAIQEARQIRPKDTKTTELLSELARMEEADRRLTEQKEALYQEAQKANREGRVASALQKLERLRELVRESGLPAGSSRDAIYERFHEELIAEHERVQSAFREARQHLEAGKLSHASAICEQMLATNPGHPMFLALKLDVENRDRNLRLEYVQDVCSRIAQVADLERRVNLLQEAVARHPGESQLVEWLRITKGCRDVVNSLLSNARKSEEAGEYSEALESWRLIEQFHPTQPNLKTELLRVQKRREEQVRTERKAVRIEEIEELLRGADYGRAVQACEAALAGFPGDKELQHLLADARARAERAEQALELFVRARDLMRNEKGEEGLQTLRQAHGLDRSNQQIRQFLGVAIIDRAQALLDSDWVAADQFLKEAQSLIPDDPAIKSLGILVADRKQQDAVERCLTSARRLARDGDLQAALKEILGGLAAYPSERRLLSERARLTKELGLATGEPPAVPAPPQAPPPEPAPVPSPVPVASAVGEDSLFKPSIAEPEVRPRPPVPEPEPARPAAAKRWEPDFQAVLGRVKAFWTALAERARAQGPPARAALSRMAQSRRAMAAAAGAFVLVVAAVLVVYSLVRTKQPVYAAVRIAASPEDAVITVDGKARGSSQVSLNLPAGKAYTIRAERPGYVAKTVTLPLSERPESVQMVLEPVLLSLQLLTDTAGAQVTLDDVDRGSSGADPLVVSGIKPGRHTLRLKTPRAEASAVFEFQPGQAPKLIELPPAAAAPATLAVSSYDRKGSAACNCPKSKFTAGGQAMLFEGGALDVTLAEGENPLELDVLGGKKMTLNARGGPELTVAMFWAVPAPAAPPLNVEQAMAAAEALEKQGEYQKALNLTERVLANSPGNARARKLKQLLDEIKATAPDQWK